MTCDYENTSVPLSCHCDGNNVNGMVELCGAEIRRSPLAQGFNIEIATLLRTMFWMRSWDRLVLIPVRSDF